MADPGFSVWGGGGIEPLGGANLRHRHFLAKMHVKMKELDPIGGEGGAHADGAPLGSANGEDLH